MKLSRLKILFLLFFVACSSTKEIPFTNDQTKANLKKHISMLASDEYEGREAGTEGGRKASVYIVDAFKKAGLKPKGEKVYLQEFDFPSGATFGRGNQLYINNHSFRVNEDFYPLPYSSNGTVTGYITRVGYGIYAPSLKHDDYKGKTNLEKKIFVMDAGSPDGNNPHGKFGDYDLRQRVQYAQTRGAKAVIFILKDTALSEPVADFTHRITPDTVPVLFVKGKAASLLRDSVITNCTVGADIQRIEKEAYNVIGWIDNGKPNTVVIGAHYDHLGYGDESSLYRGKQKEIHNGADDNASGTAALIELARMFKGSAAKNNNYLFVAFSAEEKGLLGSNYFVKHPTIDLSKVNYMVNMDMVGRMKLDEKSLIINGTGTSPVWNQVIDTIMRGVRIKKTESGVGPSDHTSFYLNNIPVLHFFSGLHSDYHKPSDDESLINYDGEIAIMNIITDVVTQLNDSGKIAFTKTKEEKNEDAPRFKVTLGVVPDYAFDGEGMRIDGVSENKPAAKAGLQKGDVVTRLGDFDVKDMMSYMKALSKFTKGETTKVKVKRGNEVIEREITF